MKSKKLDLKPTAGHLLLQPMEAEVKTASGIYLPETSGEKPAMARVLKVGEDTQNERGVKITSPAKTGELVIYKEWSGNKVKIEGKEYIFAKFEDILGIAK